jgi:hypothetical protein
VTVDRRLVGLVTVTVPADRERRDPLVARASRTQNYRGHGCRPPAASSSILTVLVIDAGRSVLGAIGVGSRAG